MRHLPLLVLALASACADPAPGDPANPGDPGTAAVPCPADGTCHPTTVCDAPDVDCFEAASDESSTYPRETRLAQQAWAMLGDDVSLGDIATAHIAIIDGDPTDRRELPYGSPGKVQLALLHDEMWPNMSDGQVLAEMLHRLSHVIHLDPLRPDDARTYADDISRTSVETWIRNARVVGFADDEGLGGLPMKDGGGEVEPYFFDALAMGDATCQSLADDIDIADSLVLRDRLSGGFLPTPEGLSMLATASAEVPHCATVTLAQLLADDPRGALDLAADEQLLTSQPAPAALMTITMRRRAAMRAAEQAWTSATHEPWSAVRYHGSADTADELAMSVGASHHITDGGLAGALRRRFEIYEPNDIDLCDAAIAAGTAPFGADLSSDHHTPCWRLARAEGKLP